MNENVEIKESTPIDLCYEDGRKKLREMQDKMIRDILISSAVSSEILEEPDSPSCSYGFPISWV